MNSISTISARSPHTSRRKRPIRHGVYLRNEQRALQVRSNDVKRLMREAMDMFGWLREENLPTLRKWAELEVVRRAAFVGIVQSSEKSGSILSINLKKQEISIKRLVDDWRKLAMGQLVYERELLMTPAARAQLNGADDDAFAAAAARIEQLAAQVDGAEDAETPESDP